MVWEGSWLFSGLLLRSVLSFRFERPGARLLGGSHIIALRAVAHPEDFAVAEVPDGSVFIPDPRDPQADGLHHAHHFTGLDDVADAVLVLDGDEDAGQEVTDQLLGTETDGDTEDAHAGQQRRDVDV